MFGQDESTQHQSKMMNMIPDMMYEGPSKSRKKSSMPSSQLFESDSRPSKRGGGGNRGYIKNKFKMMKSQEAIGEFIAGVQKL